MRSLELCTLRYRLRLGKGSSVHFTVGKNRDFIHPDEIRRYHIVGEILFHFTADFHFVYCDVGSIIQADKCMYLLLEASGGTPVNTEDLLAYCFDLCGFDTVAVDLYHIAVTAEKYKITVRKLSSYIACMIYAVDKCFLSLLGQVDISSEERILDGYLSFHGIRYFISVLIKDPDV